MDETRDPSEAPDADPERSEPDRPSSADRLVARVAELRSQIEVIAPTDQTKGREALDRMRESQERIAALEEMLAKARERENELTTQAVRDRAKLFEADTRISELSSIAARVAAAEDARREAEAAAVESERLAAMAKTEAEAAQAEIALLRTRNAELESDMAAVSEELAAAALARAEATRMEQERNEARERAQVERRLAAEDRLRAAEAALRATELQHRLRDADRRIVQLTNASRRSDGAAGVAVETGEATPPWIELQRNGAEDAAEPEPPAEGSAAPEPVSAAPVPGTVSEAEADEEPAARDPWASTEPTMWGSSTPSLSEVGTTGERPDVIDLTREDDEAAGSEVEEEEKKKATFEERVQIDSSDRSAGWTDAWNLLRGRRKD